MEESFFDTCINYLRMHEFQKRSKKDLTTLQKKYWKIIYPRVTEFAKMTMAGVDELLIRRCFYGFLDKLKEEGEDDVVIESAKEILSKIYVVYKSQPK